MLAPPLHCKQLLSQAEHTFDDPYQLSIGHAVKQVAPVYPATCKYPATVPAVPSVHLVQVFPSYEHSLHLLSFVEHKAQKGKSSILLLQVPTGQLGA